MRLHTARFTLQPLIENCIVHGLEPSGGRLTIRVEAATDDAGRFALRIRDTGPGIPPDRLAELNAKLAAAADGDDAAPGHIGLMNVHRRIRYTFGEPYGLSIASGADGGATVVIRLPDPDGSAEASEEEAGGCGHASDLAG